MRKLKMLIALMGVMVMVGSITGCGDRVNDPGSPGAAPDANVIEEVENLEEDEHIFTEGSEVEVEPLEPGFAEGGLDNLGLSIEEMTGMLTENEYPDLEVTAVVLERMAILPGSTIRVSVVITNNGDQTIAFVHGSGSNEVPDALKMVSEDLQPILPHVPFGIATMDFRVETLEPGESLNFSLFVRAIEPNEDFNAYTFSWYMDNQTYIGDADWESISQAFPNLKEVEPGPHSVSVYFFYSMVDSSDVDIFGAEATGFNRTTLEIFVD